jgi:hypothetical protein
VNSYNPFGSSGDEALSGLPNPDLDLRLDIELPDRMIRSDQPQRLSLPDGAFKHTDPSETIGVEATLPDGSPLPSWIIFDANEGVFTITAPNQDGRTVDIQVTARDTQGNEATSTFRVQILDGDEEVPLGPDGQPVQVEGEAPIGDGDTPGGENVDQGDEDDANQAALPADQAEQTPVQITNAPDTIPVDTLALIDVSDLTNSSDDTPVWMSEVEFGEWTGDGSSLSDTLGRENYDRFSAARDAIVDGLSSNRSVT